jgi:GNAT superfamily N-acetyltransferase
MAVEGAEVTRTYLELRDPGQLRGDPLLDSDGHVEQVVECPVSFFRFLYAEVGRAYHWVDRLPWSDDEIRTYLRRPGVSIHVLYVEGSPAGYFELVRSTDASTEIAYFGLLPEFLGRGLGKKLLTFAAEAAFRGGARRVWLHTCTLDDPAALPNYLARGFRPFKTESYLFRGPAEGIKNVV